MRTKQSRIPLKKSVQHGFGVAVRMESVPQGLQFTAQFQVVVNLAIEGDGGIAIVADDGLIAAAQVDDFQPHGAQGRQASFQDALLVRPAMQQRQDETLRKAPGRASVETCKACNATHLDQIAQVRKLSGHSPPGNPAAGHSE